MADGFDSAPSGPDDNEILSRAAWLEERLSGGCNGEEPAAGEAEALLARWRDRAARSDPSAFARRLAWDGWDLATVRRCLAPGHPPAAAPPPPWLETLREIERAEPAAASPASAAHPLPFEDLFTAHRAVGRRRLERELAADAGIVSPAAWSDLDRGLSGRLGSLCADALIAAFDEHRGGRPDSLTVRLAEAGIRVETRLYRSFVGSLQGTRSWPVLARLAATLVDQWTGAAAEMIRRLREDGPEIGRAFFPCGPSDAALLGVVPDLSDPHQGGRTVHILTLPGGRLVYKPRSLGLEEDFARLLAWCGERGLSLDLRSPRSLDRGTHGWMELAPPAPCPDEGAARRFHRRAGMLLGLLYAFGSRDCHFENLIACGEHPVLIDLEAWLPIRLRRWPPGEGLAEARNEAARSVLSTGFLPQWQEERRGELRNVGALGGGRPGRRLRTEWRAVNSDAMVRVRREAETPVQPNVPVLAGEPLEPSAFLPEVEAGFTEVYELLLRHRGELLGPQGPLGGLAGRRTRLILRSTPVYRRLLARSLSADCCRDGAARGIELELLARVYLEAGTRPEVWPLFAAERQALAQADIPLFLVPADGMKVEIPGGGSVDGALAMSSLDALAENLQGLGAEDLRLQTGFLRAALAPAAPVLPEDRGEPFLAAAGAIAGKLRDRAVLAADGSAAWIGPRHLPAGEIHELAPLGPGLYGGTAGIALFLAAFAQATGDDRARDLALRGVATLRRSAGPDQGIGGLTGIPSVVYALVWIGELLGEEALIQEALELSARIDPQRIAADRDLDVVFGSAGALLALLSLDRRAPQPNPAGRTALEIAADCADHLLARPLAAGGAPLAGFAHGPSGIGYALLRLYERTGREELRDAARAGFACERQLPSSGEKQGTWCRGAPGIALARLGTLDVLDGPDVREEIALALETTRDQPLSALDHLCCGSFGRVEVLLEASRILGDPAPLAAAREIAERVLARTAPPGRFVCVPRGGSDLTDLSLFRGEAGIGLALLRLAGRGDLPCVLRLAPPPARGMQMTTRGVVD